MGNTTEARTPLAAWQAFCDGLNRLGVELVECVADDLEQVTALRKLASLVVDATRASVEGGDAEFPRFSQIKETPEIADYWYAPIAGHLTYRVTGNIASVRDINISVHPHRPNGPAGDRSDCGDVGRDQLQIDNDGTFEVILSPFRHAGNWLRLPPDAGYVLIREYFDDWLTHTPGRFEIVRVGSETEAPPRPDPSMFCASLDQTLDLARDYLRRHLAVRRLAPTEPNRFSRPARQSAGSRHTWFSYGTFALEPETALVITTSPSGARSWCLQWLTSPWYSNPDLINRSTSLMGSDVHIEADGSARIVVGPDDIGCANWLDTTGYQRGVVVVRWLWCDREPSVDARAVSLDELRSTIGWNVVSPGHRAREIARRRAHFATRRR